MMIMNQIALISLLKTLREVQLISHVMMAILYLNPSRVFVKLLETGVGNLQHVVINIFFLFFIFKFFQGHQSFLWGH